MCELDKKKLGKMIDLVLKGELELDKKAFKTLTLAYENSVNFVEQPIMVPPMTLRPPPMPPIVITKTVTTTTRIERIPKNKQSFADCVKEMRASMEKGEKLTIGKYDDSELGIKSKEEMQLILDANEMVLARD